ncbi:hypothetical protein ACLMJK_006125 [Lecanora helva]
MSLVLLAHACSHLQNASLARLGLTSLPSTNQLHTLMLQLQRSGYINTVVTGGPTPPPPSALAPTMSANPEAKRDLSGHVATWSGAADRDRRMEFEAREERRGEGGPAVTQANVASRRLWVGLKYYNSKPVLEKMRLVSKPTRRVWMSVGDLEGLLRGQKRGYVEGLRGIGEALYLTTDRGIMEIRDCVERKIGGMLLCRVNGVDF